MKIEVFFPLINIIFKGFLYYAALKVRKLEARFITCAVCAGAPMLAGYIPIPAMIHFALTIIISAFIIMKNTEADLYPDGVGIPFAVEIIAAFVFGYVVIPLIELL